jgi:transcription initiation factor TFIIIB Brf1 subunit/transcription initiation factor TFIIB
MLSPAYSDTCAECTGKILDLNDEFVCSSCGKVSTKEIIDNKEKKRPQAVDYTRHALGGYLGPLEYGYAEKFSRGFSKASSSFRYLKLVSDYSGREESSVYVCAKMIERVCEKLSIPSIVIGQAVVISKKLFELRKTKTAITVAGISAYSIIAACKIEGVTSIGVREIIDAHRDLGHRVKISSIIRISLDSSVKIEARKAEDYLNRVLSRLSTNEVLKLRLGEIGLNEITYYNQLFETGRGILKMLEKIVKTGHSPCALAATSIYAAEVALSKLQDRKKMLTQRDAAACVEVAEYTVREQYGEIFRPYLEQINEVVIRLLQELATQTPQTRPIKPDYENLQVTTQR